MLDCSTKSHGPLKTSLKFRFIAYRRASRVIPLQVIYSIFTKIYKLKHLKQRKPCCSEDEQEETIFLKPEDQIILELSSWSFTFPMHSQLVTSQELKNHQLMGLVMVVDAQKIPEFRQKLKSLIDEL